VSDTTSEADARVHGPVDFLLLEFPADRLTGAVIPRLIDLIEAGTIRVYDLMLISKSADGAVEAIELRDSPIAQDFTYFAGAQSGLLDDDDMNQAAEAMSPGTVAALLVYENSWAIPFVAAAQESGAEVIAGGRIPAPLVVEALEGLEARDATPA
jgi:dihydroorotase-like cyclic amidohydrolase